MQNYKIFLIPYEQSESLGILRADLLAVWESNL